MEFRIDQDHSVKVDSFDSEKGFWINFIDWRNSLTSGVRAYDPREFNTGNLNRDIRKWVKSINSVDYLSLWNIFSLCTTNSEETWGKTNQNILNNYKQSV